MKMRINRPVRFGAAISHEVICCVSTPGTDESLNTTESRSRSSYIDGVADSRNPNAHGATA